MSELQIILTKKQLDELAELIANRIAPAAPAEEPGDPPLLSVAEACEELNIGRTKLWEMRRRGRLRAVQIGRAVRFRREDIQALKVPA